MDSLSKREHCQILSKLPVNKGWCPVLFDNVETCWRSTPPGVVQTVSCSTIIACQPGTAYRNCTFTGIWSEKADYQECIPEQVENEEDRGNVPIIVANVYFVLSIISLLFLLQCLGIFCYFQSLQCPRLTVHKNLMVALIIFYVSNVIYLEPYIKVYEDEYGDKSYSANNYRKYPWLCKSILSLQIYGQMASIIWLFNEGFYLHARIAVKVFSTEAPLLFFNLIGWVVPGIIVVIWALIMESNLGINPSCPEHYETNPQENCWKGWPNSPWMWLLTGPMFLALGINLLFLCNIVRILVLKLRATSTPEVDQVSSVSNLTSLRPVAFFASNYRPVLFPGGTERMTALAFWKAIKATFVLFFFLGTSNLLFCINPRDKGIYEDAYMLTNSVVRGSQGTVVCIFYCIISPDVRILFSKKCYQFQVRRETGNLGTSRSDFQKNTVSHRGEKKKIFTRSLSARKASNISESSSASINLGQRSYSFKRTDYTSSKNGSFRNSTNKLSHSNGNFLSSSANKVSNNNHVPLLNGFNGTRSHQLEPQKILVEVEMNKVDEEDGDLHSDDDESTNLRLYNELNSDEVTTYPCAYVDVLPNIAEESFSEEDVVNKV